jgi:hypothetical protein
MKQRLQHFTIMAALAMLMAPAAGLAANPNPAGAPPQNPPTQAAGQEKHPVMRKAIRQLENVKLELQNDAARDFDGHRANAVKQIDEAIEQLKDGDSVRQTLGHRWYGRTTLLQRAGEVYCSGIASRS